MKNWPDRRILDLFGVTHPILQAPMAGASTPAMAIAVGQAGGLGALACAMLSLEAAGADLAAIRAAAPGPINLNFFCHRPPAFDAAREAAWRARLAPYYAEQGLEPGPAAPGGGRAPFDEAFCAFVEEAAPEVVSFHFGLPAPSLLERVHAAGGKVIASATTVAEARWLEARGCDAIIAMGAEAGGHRGAFLNLDMATQVGTFALVPQVADAVAVPVIAAGGIADARGVVAALTLGASAVQIGTAYLFSPEASVSDAHRVALAEAGDDATALTNLFTGRPARSIVNRLMAEIGPMSEAAPAFPLAAGALAPLRAGSLAAGSPDFIPLWSGQAAALAARLSAGEFTTRLAEEALKRLG
ncbi:MAG TPA: nitronate monooxygenase family protein [Caulobacteraceae bacterium]|jgi:nitronate monooxygenase|nr:nitronate monooxygenase family protein [Caulobacteraceae bacterium]